jgi:hypothetical protein
MAGLYSKNNLKETGLNKTEALQKLYGPGIQNDIRLFAFSESLFSSLSPIGLENAPFVDSNNVFINRTKFICDRFTFPEENDVWIDSVAPGFRLDQRTESELEEGSSVIYAANKSLANIEVLGIGSGYSVIDADGEDVVGDVEVVVNVEGLESGAKNARFRFTIDTESGTLKPGAAPILIEGGSGYNSNENLQLLPQCQENEDPTTSKCLNYPLNSNRLVQTYYPPVAFLAAVRATTYKYSVRGSDDKGFFLFNNQQNEWVWLGAVYDFKVNVADKIVLKRSDRLQTTNLLNLERLEGTSQFFTYSNNAGGSYTISGPLSTTLSLLASDVARITTKLNLLYQNVKRQREKEDPLNRVGIRLNLYEGANLNTSFRMIFRDPDGVLDLPEVTFLDLRENLTGPDEIELELPSVQEQPLRIPGIWVNIGGVYKRAFSTSDKPFQSIKGRSYISPMLFRLADGETDYQTGELVEREETGENKYSLAASYLKFGESGVVGFDTTILSLVQNLSGTSDPQNGGITYHTPITSTQVRAGIEAWPLFPTSNRSYSILSI